jgi:hypothetical protein
MNHPNSKPTCSPTPELLSGVRSLEVRWIFPGQLEATVAGWFGQFAATSESREDIYLLAPELPGLSVKLRGGQALEVKVYRGSAGILEVARRARGRVESWQKWSFPFSPLRHGSGDLGGWRPVRKSRRISRFSLVSGQIVMGGTGPSHQARCGVELTEVRLGSQDWWSLGFEAIGPADLLRGTLKATVAFVFARPMPSGIEPSLDESRSYAEWLSQRLAPTAYGS